MNEFTANGPTYPVVSYGMTTLHRLNAVEWAKRAAIHLSGAKTDHERRRVSNWAIDIFIAAKFVVIAFAWWLGLSGPVAIGLSLYLLGFNLFTYFWHHVWLPITPAHAVDNAYRERRRFLNLLSAVAFSMMTYAYLYHRVFPTHFDWPRDIPSIVAALMFSVGNALTGATGDLRAKTAAAYVLMSSQLIMTFVFVAVLLNTSIPGQKRGQEEK